MTSSSSSRLGQPAAWLAAWIIAVAGAAAYGAEPPAAEESEDATARATEFLELATAEAATYEVRTPDGESIDVERESEPLLRWSNPLVGEIYGGVFLWTRDGCPHMVASIYKWYSPYTHTAIEMQSLTTEPFTVHREGDVFWNPSRSGITYKTVADAPAPARSEAGRLRQMRILAREFRAEETDRQGTDYDLRLLTQPLYRYDSGDPDVLDGAVFAFVLATDPDALLLLEARRDGTEHRWHYAVARMNSVALRVFHNEQEVWTVEELSWSTVQDRTQPYTAGRKNVEDIEPNE